MKQNALGVLKQKKNEAQKKKKQREGKTFCGKQRSC